MGAYHVRRKEKEITDPGDMLGVLRRGRYAVVAMVGGGQPYLVTMNYGLDEDAPALYFHCARAGRKLDCLREGGKVCATVVEDLGYRMGECDHAYRSVVMYGEMTIMGDVDEKKHGIGVMLQHLEDDPDTVRERVLSKESVYDTFEILKLDIATMTGKQGV